LDITRVENEDGDGYTLRSKTNESIEDQIKRAGNFHSLAIVDDVLYTGFTVFSIIELLPKSALSHCHLFFTRGMEETKKILEAKGCSVFIGVSLRGRVEVDVSTISTLNLVAKGAIHTKDQGDITYSQRQEWVEAWFPKKTANIVDLAEAITSIVKSFSPRDDTEERIV
jgi:hypothetical protein